MDITSGKIARRTIFILIITLGFNAVVRGQAFKRAQLHIDTLCAERFHGRGYGFDGHTLAAQYIANEFKKLGLKPVYPDYFHPFPIKANVFEGDMEVTGLQEFVPGTAFIPDVATPTIEGTFQVVYPDVNDAQNLKKVLKKKGKKNRLALVIDSNWYSNTEAMKSVDRWLDKNTKHMVIKAQKKLTWGTARWQKSYGSILMTYDVLQALGDKISVNIDAELKTIKSQNVVGMIEGTEKPDSFIWFTAHYDHLGSMGRNVYIPGANDNASGVAMMLEMAKYYSENPPAYSMMFIGFSGEEAGLVGSYHLAEVPPSNCGLNQIRFLVNIDLMGSGQDGVMAVNGSVFMEEWRLLDSLNKAGGYLKTVKRRGKAANSDHYHFTNKGVRGFFFYLMGPYQFYHEVDDNENQLTLDKHFDQSLGLFTKFVDALMGK